jgi:adenylosuccinate synthase
MEYIKEIDEYDSLPEHIETFVDNFRSECGLEVEFVQVSKNKRHVRVLCERDMCVCFEQLKGQNKYYIWVGHSIEVSSQGGDYVESVEEAVDVALQIYQQSTR